MTNQKIIRVIITACAVFAFNACGGGSGGNSGTPDPFSTAAIPGDVVTITAGSQTVHMIYANNRTSITFPTGTDDSGTATITGKFFMGETQVTNTLFAEVFQWAYDHSKFSSIVSDHNGLDSTTVKFGGQQLIDLVSAKCRINYSGGSFTVDSGYENHPVVYVTWYGAVVFCNWMTEMTSGNTLNLVYSGIDQTWDHTETSEDASKKGYRLSSCDEYEYAARYRGDDPVNTVAGYSNPCFTKGNSASGAYTLYNDVNDTNPENGVVDGKEANNDVAVFYSYWDGDSWEWAGVTTALTAVGSRDANTLGLFDMSGNIYQWCFNERFGSNRILRGGGSWWDDASLLQIGELTDTAPSNSNENMGFRIARTQ